MRPPNDAQPRPRGEAGNGARQGTHIIGEAGPAVEPLLLDLRAVARLLSVSPRTVGSMRSTGRLPAPVRIGRRVLWRRAEIVEWIDAGCPSRDAWDRAHGGRP